MDRLRLNDRIGGRFFHEKNGLFKGFNGRFEIQHTLVVWVTNDIRV